MIGSPVRHSLSPPMHNAAFRAMDLDWVYLAFEVPPGWAPAALDAMRALGIDGLSVTMPHKAAVAGAADVLTPAAEALGAANTVVRRPDGALLADNTDGAGFLASLADEGFDPMGCRALVLGAGGAARAVIRALAEAGAKEVVVVNRSPDNAARAAAMAQGTTRIGSAGDASSSDLIVNATPVGMGERGDLPLDPALVGPGQLVVDLVYHPVVTPLLAEAGARGAATANGLGMLMHQAALAFRQWTGVDAPLDAMSEAARRELIRMGR